MGKDIHLAGFGCDVDKNIVGLKRFNSLNLVNSYSIQCHYAEKEDMKIKAYVRKTSINTIALREDAGIIVEIGK